MTITSITLDKEYLFTLDNGVITRRRILTEGYSETIAGPPGVVIELAASDEYLFALQGDGAIYRRHGHSATWSRIQSVPLGTTSIATTQHELQMIHAAGSMISALWLPGDYSHFATDTTGVSDVVQVAGDEKQRLILLADGTVMVQDYSRGGIEAVPAPAGTTQIEISEDFAYFLDASGEIWRARDYSESTAEKLAGVTGITTLGVRSDHVDTLFYADGTSVYSVEPDNWTAERVQIGWHWGAGNTGGFDVWSTDWVEVQIA